MYRAVNFWTELLTQEQLKHGYVAPNRYYNYTVVITNWFTATKYIFLKKQWILFPICVGFFLSTIMDNTFTGLTL